MTRLYKWSLVEIHLLPVTLPETLYISGQCWNGVTKISVAFGFFSPVSCIFPVWIEMVQNRAVTLIFALSCGSAHVATVIYCTLSWNLQLSLTKWVNLIPFATKWAGKEKQTRLMSGSEEGKRRMRSPDLKNKEHLYSKLEVKHWCVSQKSSASWEELTAGCSLFLLLQCVLTPW